MVRHLWGRWLRLRDNVLRFLGKVCFSFLYLAIPIFLCIALIATMSQLEDYASNYEKTWHLSAAIFSLLWSACVLVACRKIPGSRLRHGHHTLLAHLLLTALTFWAILCPLGATASYYLIPTLALAVLVGPRVIGILETILSWPLLTSVSILIILISLPPIAKHLDLWVFFLLLSCWSIFLLAISFLEREIRFPVLLPLIGFSLLFSYLGINGSYALHLSSKARKTAQLPLLQDDFRMWLQANVKNPDQQTEPYPVVLVFAEGGGMRAAFQTSLILRTIQNSDPTFSRHLYAISGVSGGAVGGGTFVAECRQLGDSYTEPNTEKLRTLFGSDCVTPVLVNLGGPNVIKTCIPLDLQRLIGLFPDRASLLEQTYEEAYQTARNKDLSELDLIPDKPDQGASTPFKAAPIKLEIELPRLFANATCVETGQRAIFGPAKIKNSVSVQPLCKSALDSDNLGLSSVMFLSARFPFVSPPGSLQIKDNTPDAKIIDRCFVDGGYADNTGAATMNEILRELIPLASKKDNTVANVRFIVVGISSTNSDRFTDPNLKGLANLDFAASVLALFQTTNGHADAARMAFRLLDNDNVDRIEYQYQVKHLPLGWTMSKHTLDALAGQIKPGPDNICNAAKIQSIPIAFPTASSLLERQETTLRKNTLNQIQQIDLTDLLRSLQPLKVLGRDGKPLKSGDWLYQILVSIDRTRKYSDANLLAPTLLDSKLKLKYIEALSKLDMSQLDPTGNLHQLAKKDLENPWDEVRKRYENMLKDVQAQQQNEATKELAVILTEEIHDLIRTKEKIDLLASPSIAQK